MSWSESWEMSFNPSKCSVLHLGSTNSHNEYSFLYREEAVNLKHSEEVRDLGVTIDARLEFSSHINNIVSKANRQLGLLKRSFKIRDTASMLLLYKSTIRPILEYGSPVWSPWKIRQIDQIEQIQRRFTKIVAGMEGLDYSQRLKKLNLPTLQYRRRREQLIQVYKLINNAYDTDCSTFFERDNRNVTRVNSYKLKTKRARLMLRANFFSVGVVRDWNSLPDTVVTSGTLNQFKNSLDRHFSADKFAQR